MATEPRELLNAARLTTQRSRSCSRAQGHANEVSGSLTRHKGETRSCTSSKLVSTINTIMPRGKKGQQANKVKDQNIMQFCLSMHSQVKVKNVCQQSRCHKVLFSINKFCLTYIFTTEQRYTIKFRKK